MGVTPSSAPPPSQSSSATTHIGVIVVTVSGQEHLPHLPHAAQQQWHTGLRGTVRAVGVTRGLKGLGAWGGLTDTHILHHVFLQVLQRLLLQAALQGGMGGEEVAEGCSFPPTPKPAGATGSPSAAHSPTERCTWSMASRTSWNMLRKDMKRFPCL